MSIGGSMRGWRWVTLIFVGAVLARGAETYPVVDVTAPDRVVVIYRGLPVSVELSHLEVPGDAPAKAACQEALGALVRGRKAELLYLSSFGSDNVGGARVQLVVDGVNVNAALVAKGLARFQAGAKPDGVFEQPVKDAQLKAEKGKLGLWAGASVATVRAAPPTSPPSAPPSASRPTGPFCSELDNDYFYAAGSAEVANVNPQRLIFYPDEAAAKRAGKKAKLAAAAENLSSDGSEASADAIFAKGKDAYAQAIAKGNTPERDALYEQAFTILSKAMQVYSALCEKRPDDAKLGEKLHECMQLRYGAVKQRRFE